jgi:tetratricopeptide (TPR) repeat protein
LKIENLVVVVVKENNMKKTLFLAIFLMFIISCFVLAGDEALQRAAELSNQGKYDEAINVLKDELVKDPNNADICYSLSLAYLNKQDYDAALDPLEKAVSLSQNNVSMRYSLAMLYEKHGDNTKAKEQWQRILELSPSDDIKDCANKHITHLGST